MRLVVSVGPQTKELASLRLDDKGNLYISLKHAEREVDLTMGVRIEKDASPVIGEQRYSVHPSLRSPDGNLIKHTLATSLGKRTSAHFTKAIRKGLFAPLFVRRTPQLALAKHNAEPGGSKNVSVGRYEPERFTLLYALIVGQDSAEWKVDARVQMPSFFNSKELIIGPYKVVALTTYLPLPPGDIGALCHFQTFDPETHTDPERVAASRELMEGLDNYRVLALCTQQFVHAQNGLIAHIRESTRSLPSDLAREALFSLATLLPEGRTSSPVYRSFLRALNRSPIVRHFGSLI